MTPSDERGFGSTSDGKTSERGQLFKIESTPKDFKPTGGPLELVPEKQFLEMKADRDRLAERVKELEALERDRRAASCEHPKDQVGLCCVKSLENKLATSEADNAALTQRLAAMEEALKDLVEACKKVDHHFLTRPIAKARQALEGQ